jgi:hypothetical protein
MYSTAPPGGNRKRIAFPRPRGTVPCRPAGPSATKASARPGGCEAPAMGGSGAGRGLWPPAGGMSTWRCGRGDGPCQLSGDGTFTSPNGVKKRTAFPRLCGTVPCRPAGPETAEGQRPTRRARSARRGRGGRWPGALAPGGPRVSVALWQGRWPLPERPGIPQCTGPPLRGGTGNATRVSPARARRCPVDRQAREQPPTGRLHAQRKAKAMAPARPRKAGTDRKLSCFPVRQSRRPERCHPFVRSGALPHP